LSIFKDLGNKDLKDFKVKHLYPVALFYLIPWLFKVLFYKALLLHRCFILFLDGDLLKLILYKKDIVEIQMLFKLQSIYLISLKVYNQH